MPAPGRRVGAAAKPLDCRAREDTFNASTQTRRGFALALPDRLEHSQHVIGFNLVDRHLTNDGISVVHKRLSPLATASHTLEPIGHVTFRHFPESGRRILPRCRRDDCLRTRALDRINPVIHQSARSTGFVPSFDQTHSGERAEAHVACALVQCVAINPGSCTAWPYLQIETGTVGMQADLGERADLCFGELLDKSRHVMSPLWVTHVPPRPYASR